MNRRAAMRAMLTAQAMTMPLAGAALLSGCRSYEHQPPSNYEPPACAGRIADPIVEPPAEPQRPYQGPPVRIEALALQTAPEQDVVTIEITVPTGGWTLALDKGSVENGVARVYLTLEKPGADEWVTAALARLSERFSTTTPFERCEVYVHLAKRDELTLTTDYRLAASWPSLSTPR